jgi:hypothetical protein
MKRTITITLGLAVVLALGVGAQDDIKTVKADDFESGLSGWMMFKVEEGKGFGVDADSKISVTNDAQQVKAGKGALFYSYELTPKTMRLLGLQRELNLTGMKSVRFYVKCSATTAVLFGIHEKGGADYHASIYCPGNAWQEVVVNLDELTLGGDSKDSNGKLDLDQIESLLVTDVGGFLVNLLPEIKGSRVMWLDDIVFSSKPVALTLGATKTTTGKSVYVIDNFESPLIRWSPASIELSATPKINIFDAPVTVDADVPSGGGKQSLKFTYTRKAMVLPVLMRDVEKLDLKQATDFNLRLKTSRDGTFVVTLKEKDESSYQQFVQLKSVEDWKELSYALSSFKLDDNSSDENGKLDADQIKEISIADATTLLMQDAGNENNLWMDEVQFSLSQ